MPPAALALAPPDDQAILATTDAPSLLRFITCGSVDDGKSTLLGRLLHDARALPEDQLELLRAESRRMGTQGDAIDFALLVDGLAAEREQGITIDVAYRYFATERRSFIAADTPGHEQYTRNMVTGASTADLAIILVDARKGILPQTRRHARIAQLVGIRHVVLAVNKMDLVGHDRAVFDRIVAAFDEVASFPLPPVAIPMSGLTGENVATRSPAMDWYSGPTLLAHLEEVATDDAPPADGSFRLPVQLAVRPSLDFRGFAGQVTAGAVTRGMRVRVVPSGRTTTVARIIGADGERRRAVSGEAVTLCLADEVDCARGSVIVAADDPPEVADRLDATLVWMDEAPLAPGRSYAIKLATQSANATVRPLSADGAPAPASLALNDIGAVAVTVDRPLAFEPYVRGAALGGFVLIDRATNATVAAGMIDGARRRGGHLHWHATEVTREARAGQKGQAPCVLWFTGLSGSGKSTIANLVERKLHAAGRHSFLLDGDNVRHGLSRDLGFSAADRDENVRRVGEVARLMADAGLIVLAAFISPFAAERDKVRAMLPAGEFIEIFVDAPLAVAEARDPKGLYAKARAGGLPAFTGVDSPYEPPVRPELRIDTLAESAEAAADRIVEHVLGTWAPVL